MNLRLPKFKPIMDLFTVLPFAIPGIVLTFGYLRTYGAPPLALTNTEFGTAVLLIGGYTIGVLPYTYRAIDTGLRAIDIRTLTEAARSLGDDYFSGHLAQLARRRTQRVVAHVRCRYRRIYVGELFVPRRACLWLVHGFDWPQPNFRASRADDY